MNVPNGVEATAMRVQQDGLSRPYRLPSGGVFYEKHDGRIVIRPMRGEEEEVIAGAAGNKASRFEALNYVIGKCVDLKGLTLERLLIADWTGVLVHLFALTAGSDDIAVTSVHERCGKQSTIPIALTMLPCVSLRRQEAPEEQPSWPQEEESSDARILREMDEAGNGFVGERALVVAAGEKEPYTTDVLPHVGVKVTWRFARVDDILKAEEFVARSETPGRSAFHTFVMSRRIVAIDNKPAFPLQSLTWVRSATSPTLNALRAEMSRRDFGYDLAPRVKCQSCGGMFKAQMDLGGDSFRRTRSAAE